MMIFTLAPGKSLETAATANLQNYNLSLVESKKTTINGLPSIIMIADQKQEQGTLRVLSALIQYEGNIYNMLGISELSKFANHQATFLSSVLEFKELKDPDKLNRKPDVVRLKAVPQAMNVGAAFRHFNMPESRMEELAVLNGMNLKDEVKKGTLLKVIGK